MSFLSSLFILEDLFLFLAFLDYSSVLIFATIRLIVCVLCIKTNPHADCGPALSALGLKPSRVWAQVWPSHKSHISSFSVTSDLHKSNFIRNNVVGTICNYWCINTTDCFLSHLFNQWELSCFSISWCFWAEESESDTHSLIRDQTWQLTKSDGATSTRPNITAIKHFEYKIIKTFLFCFLVYCLILLS